MARFELLSTLSAKCGCPCCNAPLEFTQAVGLAAIISAVAVANCLVCDVRVEFNEPFEPYNWREGRERGNFRASDVMRDWGQASVAFFAKVRDHYCACRPPRASAT